MSRIDDVAGVQRGLITSSQFVEAGLTASSLQYRVRQGGPWRRVLPSVYLVGRGPLDEEDRVLAARLYVGGTCLITAGAMLRRAGVRAALQIGVGEIHVLVPHDRRRASTHFVHVQRARHWPAGDDGLDPPGAPLARAAIDACRTLDRRGDVAALLTELVRESRVTIDDLRSELARAQRRRSALVRDVLKSLDAGTVSAAEDELYRHWQSSPLPEALWNVDLLVGGEFLARPDVYLREHGVVVEVDSVLHHASVDDWDRTMRRHARMTARGLVVLHVTPRRIRQDWTGVCADVLDAVKAQEGRVLPRVEVRRPT